MRISYLDGHRGLAILAVVAYHALSRWADRVPFTDAAAFPPVAYGWIGVELFFLISGFVILMTLEKCESIGTFLLRRWLRLFPAMLICSLLIAATAAWLPDRPSGPLSARDLLPGLLFMELSWWPRVFGEAVKPADGSFWSLFVEFKFYVFAAIAFYLGGTPAFFWSIVGAFALDFASGLAALLVPSVNQPWLRHALGAAPFNWFGWFAAGAAFHVFTRSGRTGWFIAACILGCASSAHVALLSAAARAGSPIGSLIAALFVTALFAVSTVSRPLQRFLSSRPLQFFGFVSYPLYLLHQDIAVAIMIALGHRMPPGLHAATPALAIAPILAVAYLIATSAEPSLRRLLAALLPDGARRTGVPAGMP